MYQHPRNVSVKIQKDHSCIAGDIPKYVGFHRGSMPTTRLRDKYKNQNYLWSVPTSQECFQKFQKDILSRTGYIPFWIFMDTFLGCRYNCSKYFWIPNVKFKYLCTSWIKLVTSYHYCLSCGPSSETSGLVLSRVGCLHLFYYALYVLWWK